MSNKLVGFRKLSLEQKEQTYGGWAWLAFALPLLVQSIATAIGTYKMFDSDQGSVKVSGYESHWDNDNPSEKVAATKTMIYAY